MLLCCMNRTASYDVTLLKHVTSQQHNRKAQDCRSGSDSYHGMIYKIISKNDFKNETTNMLNITTSSRGKQ